MKKRKLTSRKKILTTVVALLILVVAGVVAHKVFSDNNSEGTYKPTQEDIKSGVNYDPPTDTDKRSNEEAKTNAEERQNIEKNGTDTKARATVTVSSAEVYDGSVEVRAFAAGVIEDGGTCSVEFVKNSEKLTKVSNGTKDATTTICAPVVFPQSELSRGTWTVQASYSSSKASGASQKVNMRIE